MRSRVREKREGRREGREDVQVADGSEKRRAISRHVIFISWLDRRHYQRCLHVQVALI